MIEKQQQKEIVFNYWEKKKILRRRENFLKFKDEGWEFAKSLRSLQQFILPGCFSDIIGEKMGFKNLQEKLPNNGTCNQKKKKKEKSI